MKKIALSTSTISTHGFCGQVLGCFAAVLIGIFQTHAQDEKDLLGPKEAVAVAQEMAAEYIESIKADLEDPELTAHHKETIAFDIATEKMFMLLLDRLQDAGDEDLLAPAVIYRFLFNLTFNRYEADPESVVEVSEEVRQNIELRERQLSAFLEVFETEDPEVAEALKGLAGIGQKSSWSSSTTENSEDQSTQIESAEPVEVSN